MPKMIRAASDRDQRILRRIGAWTRGLSTEGFLTWAEDEQQAPAKQFARRKFGRKLAIARMQIACLSYLAQDLWFNSAENRRLPVDWLDSSGVPNAAIALSLVICELANYCFSVVDLVERGLTGPARSLVRSAGELSSIIIILVGDRDAFREYLRYDEVEDPGVRWYQLFSGKKLAQRIEVIERSFGVPDRTIAYMREFRATNAKFFSLAVHHSFHAVMDGATINLPNNKIELRALGGPHQLSHHTLTYLICSTQMCLMVVFKFLLGMKREPMPAREQRLLLAAAKLYFRSQNNFMRWLEAG